MPVEAVVEENTESNKKRKVYEILRNKIVHNELKPQEYLNEQSICDELGVSKTPVREALQKLEHNRLVVIVPNKGCFVSNISIDRIREVFEIRAILECAAARLAATSEARNQFKSILENHESFKIHTGEEMRHYLLSGYQIHTHIVEAAGNSYLMDFYRTILDHIVQIRVYFLSRFKADRLQETVEEHKKILEAIVIGDADGAESAMREHLKRSLIHINQMMLGNRMDL
jgi:GntR family transcriptional regulator, rspAB operon transcriptional repressor